MNKIMEDLLKNFSENTTELLNFMNKIDEMGIENLTREERNQFLKQLEIIEDITGKADTISQKTKRDGVPELESEQSQKIELKSELKKEAVKKPRISNLMKPSPTLNMSNSINNAEKEKKEREKR